MWNLLQDNAFSHQMSWLLTAILGSALLHNCHPQPSKPALCSKGTAHVPNPPQQRTARRCSADLRDSSHTQWFDQGAAGKAGAGHFPTLFLPSPCRWWLRGGAEGDTALCSHLSRHGMPSRFQAPASAIISAGNWLCSALLRAGRPVQRALGGHTLLF